MSPLQLVAVLLAGSAVPAAQRVGPGELRPAFAAPGAAAVVRVEAFLLDRDPVTNEAFLAFVAADPGWQRGQAPRFLVDEDYLSHWAGPLTLGPAAGPRQPVTRVSWFAARAFCEARGARLPTEAEWELAAAADATRADASDDPAFLERILVWYGAPRPARLPDVGAGQANVWGVRDLHGLVWEWVLDFNSVLLDGDGRTGGETGRGRFCGAGALGARDARDYATFMRQSFRTALEARYTVRNLGFRCASELSR